MSEMKCDVPRAEGGGFAVACLVGLRHAVGESGSMHDWVELHCHGRDDWLVLAQTCAMLIAERLEPMTNRAVGAGVEVVYSPVIPEDAEPPLVYAFQLLGATLNLDQDSCTAVLSAVLAEDLLPEMTGALMLMLKASEAGQGVLEHEDLS
jgi:hypothetical protein